MKDKLSTLLPWLEKLLVTLAKANPGDDTEEADRRSQLARFASGPEFLLKRRLTYHGRALEDISKRAVALSDKGKVARVFDKTKDSGEVAALVEKLRQAILIYQVSVGCDPSCENVDTRDRCHNSSQYTTKSPN